ncbi:uncharacterized protein LOC122216623 [Panthera leo]|uniref:uncharacterized protein LOC122216623 n=1 Tax=Panthera leo TaxID=9689 RepID=UPI001C695ABB|nr:uncharacterized protein LOC122216623 [Panthera leo]
MGQGKEATRPSERLLSRSAPCTLRECSRGPAAGDTQPILLPVSQVSLRDADTAPQDPVSLCKTSLPMLDSHPGIRARLPFPVRPWADKRDTFARSKTLGRSYGAPHDVPEIGPTSTPTAGLKRSPSGPGHQASSGYAASQGHAHAGEARGNETGLRGATQPWRQRTQQRNQPPGTLTLDFQLPELWEINGCCPQSSVGGGGQAETRDAAARLGAREGMKSTDRAGYRTRLRSSGLRSHRDPIHWRGLGSWRQ